MIVQQQGPKRPKLIITGLKVKPELPSDYEAQTWQKLNSAVHLIQQRRPLETSLEELYRCVENMCLHGMSEKLYARLEAECEHHIGQVTASLSEKLTLEPVQFLHHVEEMWKMHCHQMKKIGSIFLCLDRGYVLSVSGVKSLFDMGLQLLRSHLSRHPKVIEHTLAGLLTVIEAERKGYEEDRSILRSLLKMFSLLGIYNSEFEGVFLEATAQFYTEESERNLVDLDIPQYLCYCERRLSEEHDRCEQYLDRMTHRPLLHCVEHRILRARIDAILLGFDDLMVNNRTADLGRLFSLCSKIEALDQLKSTFSDYIKKYGGAIMMDEDKEKDMVLLLLDFKAKLDNVLSAAFQVQTTDRNNEFQQALKDAFERFINQRENKPAELTAKFIDAKLRAGNKSQSEDDLELTLDRVLTIFRFIQGKDVFEAFYKKDLSRRLLVGKSASIDAEKSMISKLKEECGSQFTNKLEGMFSDMEISKEIMDAFKQSIVTVRKTAGLNSEISIQVLTCGYWPSYPETEARLPYELAQFQEVFEDFYLIKYNGRRLQWYNSLGTCVVRARYNSALKELQVSLFQTIVLLLFNDADTLTFQNIQEGSGIDEKELKRVLQSLACGKMRLLLKEPKGSEIGPTDEFSFNADFHDARFRIRVNSVQTKESDEENQKVNESILQDRQHQIDAAIVRIMKKRRTLSHKLLMNELASQLSFMFNNIDIKKRIEMLIEREFLNRTNADPGVYEYVA